MSTSDERGSQHALELLQETRHKASISDERGSHDALERNLEETIGTT